MSIGSKPADKLVQCHCHSPHMQDSSWEQLGMIQEEVGLLLVSKHKDLLVGFCCHTWWVGNGRGRCQQGTEHERET